MLVEFLPGDLSYDLELLLLLELEDPLLYLVVPRLLVVLPALLHCLPNLLEPADDVLGNLQLQLVYVLVLDVLYGCPDKVLVHALTQQRTGLQNEPHFLLA